MTDTFYPDISKYQHVIGTDFAYPILCFRLDSGYETDPSAAANLKAALANPRIKLLIGYVVPIPGHNAQIVARVKKLLGGKCPPNMGFMLDEESGRGFAGPGDHSREWNALDAELGAFAGSSKRVIGYANTGDWSSGWPHHRPDLKRVVAKYSSTPPSISYYGWQYSDGSSKWPVPSGYPRTSTDMNVIHKPIDQILADFGVGRSNTPATPSGGTTMEEDMTPAQEAKFDKALAQLDALSWAFGEDTDNNGKPNYRTTVQKIVDDALDAKLKPIHDALDALKVTK